MLTDAPIARAIEEHINRNRSSKDSHEKTSK